MAFLIRVYPHMESQYEQVPGLLLHISVTVDFYSVLETTRVVCTNRVTAKFLNFLKSQLTCSSIDRTVPDREEAFNETGISLGEFEFFTVGHTWVTVG